MIMKTIKQTAQILQDLLDNTDNFNTSEYLFSKDSSGSGMVDNILQLPISVDDKVKCIKFIQKRIDIYDSGLA